VAALGIVAAAMSPVEDDQEGEMKWLPIETAPQDGSRLRARDDEGREFGAFYFNKIHPRDGYVMGWICNPWLGKKPIEWLPPEPEPADDEGR
jgi:hypothetical protein